MFKYTSILVITTATLVTVAALTVILAKKPLNAGGLSKLKLKSAVLINTLLIIITGIISSGCSHDVTCYVTCYDVVPDDSDDPDKTPVEPTQVVYQGDRATDG